VRPRLCDEKVELRSEERNVVTDAAAGGAEAVPPLGARLRTARQKAGLSLRGLAREMGVSASFVSQLENGKSQPSVATLYSIAQLLDVSIDELFSSTPAGTGDASAVVPTRPPGETTGPGARRRKTEDSSTARGRRQAPAAPATTSESAAQDLESTGSRGRFAMPAEWPSGRGLGRLSVTRPGERVRLVMETGVIWEQLATNTQHTLDFMEIVYPPGSSGTTDDRMLRHEGYEYGYLLEGELQVTFGFETFTLRAGEALGLDSSVPHLFKNTGTVDARGIWFVHHPHD